MTRVLIKAIAFLYLAAILPLGSAGAKPPQILPEPMLVNLFALTEASAALKICTDSNRFETLTQSEKAQLQRLQDGIDALVKKMARKYDADLFPFFEESRDTAAGQQEKIDEMRDRYDFCANGFIDRMKDYVYHSRQKLDYFLSRQSDAK